MLANQSEKIEDVLHSLEFKMLSFLGVKQHVKTEWWKLAHKFGGIGLFNLSSEQLISWVEVLIQDYGTGSTISKKMCALLAAVQLKIGCWGSPFNECYNTLGPLMTEGWKKAVWE
jgi:hypothetical protein